MKREFSRKELIQIIDTAFSDKRADEEKVSLEKLASYLSAANSAEEKKEVSNAASSFDAASDLIPDIKSTNEKVIDKRGNRLTLSQQTTAKIRELFEAMDVNDGKNPNPKSHEIDLYSHTQLYIAQIKS